MVDSIHIDCSACEAFETAPHITELEPQLQRARDIVCQNVEQMTSGLAIPIEQRPLDAGFIDLPSQLLQELSDCGDESLLGRIDEASEMLAQQIDRLVILGIGGSYMGARALFEALCHPCHNEQSREDRGQRPRILFSGHNVDNDVLRGNLELLCSGNPDADDED